MSDPSEPKKRIRFPSPKKDADTAHSTVETVRSPYEASPSKEQVIEARRRAEINQEGAAKLVHLSSSTRWSEYERGKRQIDPARFELFLIKTGQHPDYTERDPEVPR